MSHSDCPQVRIQVEWVFLPSLVGTLITCALGEVICSSINQFKKEYHFFNYNYNAINVISSESIGPMDIFLLWCSRSYYPYIKKELTRI